MAGPTPASGALTPSTRRLLASGAWLLILGVATYLALSQQSDNAYLCLGILIPQAPIGALYVFAAPLPLQPRRWLWLAATGLLWLTGGLGLLLILAGLVIVATQPYRTPAPFLAYFAATLIQAATLYLIAWHLPHAGAHITKETA